MSRRVSAAASRDRAASSARRAASRRSSICAPSAFARETTQLRLLGGEPGALGGGCERLGPAHGCAGGGRRRAPRARSLAAANRRSAVGLGLDRRARFGPADDDVSPRRAPPAPRPSRGPAAAPAATAAAAASRRTRGSIGLDGNGQRLVEVVETIPRIGCGEQRPPPRSARRARQSARPRAPRRASSSVSTARPPRSPDGVTTVPSRSTAMLAPSGRRLLAQTRGPAQPTRPAAAG